MAYIVTWYDLLCITRYRLDPNGPRLSANNDPALLLQKTNRPIVFDEAQLSLPHTNYQTLKYIACRSANNLRQTMRLTRL